MLHHDTLGILQQSPTGITQMRSHLNELLDCVQRMSIWSPFNPQEKGWLFLCQCWEIHLKFLQRPWDMNCYMSAEIHELLNNCARSGFLSARKSSNSSHRLKRYNTPIWEPPNLSVHGKRHSVPIFLHRAMNSLLFVALTFTSFNKFLLTHCYHVTSCKYDLKATLCRKQYVEIAKGAEALMHYTTPACLPQSLPLLWQCTLKYNWSTAFKKCRKYHLMSQWYIAPCTPMRSSIDLISPFILNIFGRWVILDIFVNSPT